MTHAEFATLGGLEGAEVIMWLVMRGALSDRVERVHSSYYLPSMTGIATLVLNDEEADLIRDRDWPGLIHYGVIFFLLEKLAAVTGVSNAHIYAAMRGESLDDFLRTRNTQVLYSVADSQAGKEISR